MDAIGVFNAGSSSIKSSLFGVHGDALEMTIHGQAEGPHECRGRVSSGPAPAGHPAGRLATGQYVEGILAGQRTLTVLLVAPSAQ